MHNTRPINSPIPVGFEALLISISFVYFELIKHIKFIYLPDYWIEIRLSFFHSLAVKLEHPSIFIWLSSWFKKKELKLSSVRLGHYPLIKFLTPSSPIRQLPKLILKLHRYRFSKNFKSALISNLTPMLPILFYPKIAILFTQIQCPYLTF